MPPKTFDPLSKSFADVIRTNLSEKHSEEYIRRQDVLFDTYAKGSGPEALRMMKQAATMKRAMPIPRTADECVNFITHHAYMAGMSDLVAQIESQLGQAETRKKKQTPTKETTNAKSNKSRRSRRIAHRK